MDSPQHRNKHLDFQLQRERDKVRQLEEALRTKQETIARLEQEKAELRRAKAYADDENKKAKSERDRIQNFQREISDKSSQIADLHKRCESIKAERDLIRSEATQSIDQWKEAEQRWVLENSSLKAQVTELRKTVDRHLSTEESLKREIDGLSSQLEAERTQSSKLGKNISELEARNQQSWEKVEELVQGSFSSQEMVVHLRGEIEHLKATVHEKEVEVDSANETSRLHLQRIEALQNSSLAESQKSETLKAKIRDLERTIAEFQDSEVEGRRRAQTQQKEIDILKREVENDHKVMEQMKHLLDEKDFQAKAVTQQASKRIEMTLTAECDDLKAQLTNERKEHTLTAFALQKAKDELSNALGEVSSAEKRCETMRLELELAAENLARSALSVTQKEFECDEVKKEAISAALAKEDEIRFLEEELSKRQKTIADQQRQLDELNNILTRLRENSIDEKKDLLSLKATKSELELLKPQLHNTQQDLLSCRTQVESLELSRNEALAQIQELNSLNHAKSVQLEETERLLQEVISDRDLLKTSIATLKEELENSLSSKAAETEQAREVLHAIQSELSEAQAAANNARRSFGGKLAALELENRSMEEELRAKDDRVAQLNREVNDLASRTAAQERLLEDSEAKLQLQRQMLSDRTQSAEETHLALKSDLVESQSTVRKLRAALEERDCEALQLNVVIENTKKKFAALEKRKQEYKDAFEELKTRLIRLDEMRNADNEKAVAAVAKQNKEILYWRESFDKLKEWCESKEKENCKSSAEVPNGKRARTEHM